MQKAILAAIKDDVTSAEQRLQDAKKAAEIINTGIHVGQGLQLHYHADGHSSTGNGLNLYNISDYTSQEHPPLIGFGYDGIALFGKYESSFSSIHL